MKTIALTNLARKVATTVGRSSGVKVVFGGKTASTEGKTIRLPGIVAGTTVTQKEANVFLGYLDHEIGHILFTDFDVVAQSYKAGPLNKTMLNILEDVREELLFIGKYPGAQSDLDAVCEKLEEEYAQNLRINGEDLGKLDLNKAGVMIYEEAYTFRNRPLIRQEGLSSFPQMKKIVSYVAKAVTAKDTRETFVYSNMIVEELKRLFPSPPQPNPQPAPGKSDQPDPKGQESEGQPGDEPSDQPGQPGDEPSDQPGQPGDEPSDQPGQPGDEPSDQPGQPGDEPSDQPGQPGEFDPTDLVETLDALSDKGNKLGAWLLSKMNEENKEDQSSPMNRTRVKRGTEILPPCGTHLDKIMFYPKEDLPAYKAELASVATEVSMLKKALHIYLKSRAQKSFERGLENGQLDSQSVWKIRAGDHVRLFKQKRSVEMVDTAVCIMLDLSGSMNPHLTRTTAILLSEAMFGVSKLKLEIAGFTTGNDRYEGKGGRSISLNIPLFKAYDEDGRKARARIGGLNTSAYTPLGEAFAYGYESLLDRKESKKVLWVVTDGEPSFPTQNDNHNDYLLMGRIHAKCKKQGIHVVGLDLGHHTSVLKDYADVNVHVPDASDLPKAVLNMVKSLIETRKI